MGQISRIVRSVKAFTDELARPHAQLPTPPSQPAKRPKIGIALGGGFARGMSHIGIIKALEEAGIPIDFVGGTSVGAVIGAAYCAGLSAKELEEISHLVRFKDFARWTISRFGVCSNDRMTGFLHKLLKARSFEDLKVPLAVAATDFVTGEGVVFSSGPLIDAVRASCAYPGMFLPVNFGGKLLVDGLLGYPVPTTPLKQMGADRVIAVHLSAHWVKARGPRHVFEVIGQCFSIAQDKMRGAWQADADIVLEPAIGEFSYDSFQRAPEMIKIGMEAVRDVLPKIKSWFDGTELDFNTQAASPALEPAKISHSLSGAPMQPSPMPAK